MLAPVSVAPLYVQYDNAAEYGSEKNPLSFEDASIVLQGLRVILDEQIQLRPDAASQFGQVVDIDCALKAIETFWAVTERTTTERIKDNGELHILKRAHEFLKNRLPKEMSSEQLQLLAETYDARLKDSELRKSQAELLRSYLQKFNTKSLRQAPGSVAMAVGNTQSFRKIVEQFNETMHIRWPQLVLLPKDLPAPSRQGQ